MQVRNAAAERGVQRRQISAATGNVWADTQKVNGQPRGGEIDPGEEDSYCLQFLLKPLKSRHFKAFRLRSYPEHQ